MLAIRFIKPKFLQNFKEKEQSFKPFYVSISNQCDDSKLFLGMSYKKKKKLIRNCDIDDAECDIFFMLFDLFMLQLLHSQQWLPLDNALLKGCRFINFKESLQHNFDNVTEVIRMPHVFGEFIDNTEVMDILEEEFIL